MAVSMALRPPFEICESPAFVPRRVSVRHVQYGTGSRLVVRIRCNSGLSLHRLYQISEQQDSVPSDV